LNIVFGKGLWVSGSDVVLATEAECGGFADADALWQKDIGGVFDVEGDHANVFVSDIGGSIDALEFDAEPFGDVVVAALTSTEDVSGEDFFE